jgi:hypothetical protein
MTYTISGKHYTEFDINKRCAELVGIEINESIFSHLKECWTVAPAGYLSVKYMPTLDGNHAIQIIDKCWSELLEMVNDCGIIDYADFCDNNKWQYLMKKHNCTKLVAACICLIEINEGKL